MYRKFTRAGEHKMKKGLQLGTAFLSGLGFLGIATAAPQAPEAKLVRVDGIAIANQDARYVPAREGMSLKAGDRLMVLEGGTAIISFTDGCRFELGAMSVLAIQGVSTCASNGSGFYQVDKGSGVARGPAPQPRLAAIGSNGDKPRSKAECDLAAKNADPNDDCSCDERGKNADKDDDCPPVAAFPPAGAPVGGWAIPAAVAAVNLGTVAILANQGSGQGGSLTPPPRPPSPSQ
jgi:hypothetical protein